MRRLLIFLLLFAASTAELLVFNETTGLPSCAYACTALYNAQYDCPPSGPEQVKCFCASNFLGWKGDSGGWNGCEEACADSTGKGRVRAWMKGMCGGEDDDDKDGEQTKEGDKNDIISEVDPSKVQSDTEEQEAAHAIKVKEWWRRNYPFFILAFLVVTIPIVSYAIAIPLRKWCKKQLIRRRPRSQAYMEDVGPYTSVFAARQSEQQLQYSPAVSAAVIAEHAITIPPETSVRQDSWEARVRDQFETKKSLGEKMKFWRK